MKIHRFILMLSLLTSCSSVGAVHVTTPQVNVEFNSSDIIGRNRAGKIIFSLVSTLKKQFGPDCSTKIKVTPLSLVGDLLSVQLDGSVCGEDISVINVFRISLPFGVTNLSKILGEENIVNNLKKDSYLKANWALSGNSLSEMDIAMTEKPYYNKDECKLGPSPVSIADNSFAFWKLNGSSVNVRLALPFVCGDGTHINSFSWLGLNVTAPNILQANFRAAAVGKGFLWNNRPRVVTIIAWPK